MQHEMIRLIDDLPDNVFGFEAVGEVRTGDHKTILDRAVDAARESHDKIRLPYVLGDDFDGYSGGAMCEDTKIGMSHLSKWEKIAIFTDHKTCQDGAKAFGWMTPGEVKVFAVANLTSAEAWAAQQRTPRRFANRWPTSPQNPNHQTPAPRPIRPPVDSVLPEDTACNFR